jgi:membrane-associated phospholipid phosphatase
MTPADKLLLAYLGSLVIASARLDLPIIDALAIAVAIGILASTWASARSRAGRVLHAFYPIVAVVGCFNLSGPVIAQLSPVRWDTELAAIDQRWFGLAAANWRVVLGRPDWLTDVASIAYVSFYIVPVAIAIALYRRADRRELDSFVSTVVTAFVLTLIGYALRPATGPRISPDEADAVLGGSAISRGIRAFLAVAERNRLDAFPSGHAALALVYLIEGGRRLRAWRLPLALASTAMVFATVYLSVHYAVDVLAGLLVGGISLLLVPLARRVIANGTLIAKPERLGRPS